MSLLSLWLPIVLSAVAVFIVSSIIHMALPWHKSDMRRLEQEDEVMEALRRFHIPPGDYGMPMPGSMAELKDPKFIAKQEAGPVVLMTVEPNGPVNMGQSLLMWFLYALLVSFFAAYIASRAVGPEAPYLSVFRCAGAAAFAGYSFALLQNSIWYKRSWVTTIKSVIDGLVYALVTAGFFGWLWPR